MDWELHERYRATLFLFGVAAVSFLLLALRHVSAVKHLRAFLVAATLPPERFLSGLRQPALPTENTAPPIEIVESSTETVNATVMPPNAIPAEQRRATQVLQEENKRLQNLLELKSSRWPASIAARVVGRDPQRWFQEIVLDKGSEDGLAVDDPVVSVIGTQEGLVGRIIEASAHVSKVMLIEDSLSAVAATVMGQASEDGVVEGNNGHHLLLHYLDRGSHAKIGDVVVTAGLGANFPAGIPIGTIEDLSLDTRQLFVQAKVKPAVKANELHVVLVLVPAKRS